MVVITQLLIQSAYAELQLISTTPLKENEECAIDIVSLIGPMLNISISIATRLLMNRNQNTRKNRKILVLGMLRQAVNDLEIDTTKRMQLHAYVEELIDEEIPERKYVCC
jgi:hypothetical protein